MEVVGNNGLQVIKDNTEFELALPWNGSIGLFRIRMLNAVQLRACGNFTTLELITEKKDNDVSLADLIKLKNMQERLIQASLVSPTYDEINEYLGMTEINVRLRKFIVDEKEAIRKLDDIEEVKKRSDIIEIVEIQLAFLYPDDFTATLTSILLQKDNTDIRKVTNDMLLDWAVLAERGNDNPADHASGVFTEFQRQDINRYAQLELKEFRDREQIVKGSKKHWIRGKKKR